MQVKTQIKISQEASLNPTGEKTDQILTASRLVQQRGQANDESSVERKQAAFYGTGATRVALPLEPTESDVEGPFYRPNAPETNILIDANFKGIILQMGGKVLDTSGKPIAGAVVEVWQADPRGNYDISDPRDRDNPAIPHAFRGRIWLFTNAEFNLLTAVPGRYKQGGTFRPAHLHFKISAPGYKSLTTQIYFKGDPFNSSDPFWSKKRTVELSQRNEGGRLIRRGHFNFVLASAK